MSRNSTLGLVKSGFHRSHASNAFAGLRQSNVGTNYPPMKATGTGNGFWGAETRPTGTGLFGVSRHGGRRADPHGSWAASFVGSPYSRLALFGARYGTLLFASVPR